MRTIQNAYPERQLAREQGMKTYYTGRPCKAGHVAPRNTVDGSCTECRTVFRAAYREQAKSYAREQRAARIVADPVGTRAKWAEWQRTARQAQPEKFRERDRKHGKLKRQRYPQRKLADTRRRQAAKILRTPVWSELDAIRRFYENCPPGYEVDHIAPLRGRTVSGLHVLANLQYLPVEENRRKNSNFDADAFSAAELQRWRTTI